MKIIFVLAFTILCFTFSLSAQNISKNALGLRLGDSDGFGTEISYQRALGSTNRLELDLGWSDNSNYDAFRFTGLYQWVYPLENAFNWYVGAGGGIASYEGKDTFNNKNETGFFVAGNIGIEYTFDIPLLISLDFRPELGFSDFTNDLGFDIGLGIRYQF